MRLVASLLLLVTLAFLGVECSEKPKKVKYTMDEIALNLPQFPTVPDAAKPLFKNDPELNPVYRPMFRPSPPNYAKADEKKFVHPLKKGMMHPALKPHPDPSADEENPQRFDDNDDKVYPPGHSPSFRDLAPGQFAGNSYYGSMPEYYPAMPPPSFGSRETEGNMYDMEDGMPQQQPSAMFGEVDSHSYVARHGRLPPPYYQPQFHSVRHHYAHKYPHYRTPRAHPYVHPPHPMAAHRMSEHDESESFPSPPPPMDAQNDVHQSSDSVSAPAAAPSLSENMMESLGQPTWPRSVAPPAQYYLPPDLPIY